MPEQSIQRQIYLDLGANIGDTIETYLSKNPNTTVYGFEPNPKLSKILRKRFAAGQAIIVEKAAWILDGVQTFYLGHDLSSTLETGKSKVPKYPEYEISYRRKTTVGTVDIARWMLEHFDKSFNITMKMDIEGAEYKVLQRLMDTEAIDLVDHLYCEFHVDRFPRYADVHERIFREVSNRTRLSAWK